MYRQVQLYSAEQSRKNNCDSLILWQHHITEPKHKLLRVYNSARKCSYMLTWKMHPVIRSTGSQTRKGKFLKMGTQAKKEGEQTITKWLTKRTSNSTQGKNKIKVLGMRVDSTLWEKKEMGGCNCLTAAALKQLCKCLLISRLTQSSWEDKAGPLYWFWSFTCTPSIYIRQSVF